MSRVRAVVVGVGAALVASLTTWTGVAQAHLPCGSVITASTTLTADIGPCTDGGLVITADNVVLDLGGHRVFGTPDLFDGAGILLDGVFGVTVRNGSVTDFDGGVVIERGGRNTVERVTVKDNIGQIAPGSSTFYGDGVFVEFSNDNVLRNNVVDHNGPFGGITVYGDSARNLLEGNRIENNNLRSARPDHEGGGQSLQEDDGIRLENVFVSGVSRPPHHNTIRNNTVRTSGLDGIALFADTHNNKVLNNVVERNGFDGNARRGDGIHVFPRSTLNEIRGNRVLGNARFGIRIDATLSIPGGVKNTVYGNIALNNAQDPLNDPATDLSDNNRFCLANTWERNRFGTKNIPGIDCIR